MVVYNGLGHAYFDNCGVYPQCEDLISEMGNLLIHTQNSDVLWYYTFVIGGYFISFVNLNYLSDPNTGNVFA